MISLSVFSIAFSSGRVLKPSARCKIISPLLFWWGKRKEMFFLGFWGEVLQKFFCPVLISRSPTFKLPRGYACAVVKLYWMSVSQSHKSPSRSDWQGGLEEKSSFGTLDQSCRVSDPCLFLDAVRGVDAFLFLSLVAGKAREVGHLKRGGVCFLWARGGHAVFIKWFQ